MSVWAVLAAAGRGERLGSDRPKAFARLGGRPLLAESLERLEGSDWIDFIVIAAPAEWEEPAILLAEELGAGKVSSVVTGGASRSESVREAMAEVADDAAVVLVHDAARPLLPDEVIERVLAPLSEGSNFSSGEKAALFGSAIVALLALAYAGMLVGQVTGADQTQLRYQVIQTWDYTLADIPMASVLAQGGGDQITLITCAGSYSRAAGYDHRLVVRAKRIA